MQLSHGIVHLWGLGMDWGRPGPSPRGCPAPVGTFAQDSQAAQGDCEATGPLSARRDPSLSRRNARNGLDSCTDAAVGPCRPSPTRPRPVHKSRICTGRLEELRRRLPGASGALRPRSRTPLEPSEPPAAPDVPAPYLPRSARACAVRVPTEDPITVRTKKSIILRLRLCIESKRRGTIATVRRSACGMGPLSALQGARAT